MLPFKSTSCNVDFMRYYYRFPIVIPAKRQVTALLTRSQLFQKKQSSSLQRSCIHIRHVAAFHPEPSQKALIQNNGFVLNSFTNADRFIVLYCSVTITYSVIAPTLVSSCSVFKGLCRSRDNYSLSWPSPTITFFQKYTFLKVFWKVSKKPVIRAFSISLVLCWWWGIFFSKPLLLSLI